jgi:hypothetical protein
MKNSVGTTREGAIACRAWPVHPNGLMAQVDRAGASVIQSSPMQRWFFGFFFYFPRHLAEGNG